MTDDVTPDERVAALERQLSESQAAHRATMVQSVLRTEAVRAGIVDLDGLKLLDMHSVSLNAGGEVVGGAEAITAMKRAKPWLFGLPQSAGSSSSGATPPPAQTHKPRLAADMTHDEWRSARADLLRHR